MKFLVLWHFDVGRLSSDVVRAIAKQPAYGERLEAEGKLECRYHVVGSHTEEPGSTTSFPTRNWIASWPCHRFTISRLTKSWPWLT